MIGIDLQTGTLSPYGYSLNGEKILGRNNISFEGYKIPGFNKILQWAYEGHARIAPCCFTAWDFALDKNNELVFLEVNLYWPGIRVNQIVSGPVFANRTEEMINLC